MRQRHYADNAQPSLRMELHWEERTKSWILTTTRPFPGANGRADVQYYKINSGAAMDRAAAELLAFRIIAEVSSWLF